LLPVFEQISLTDGDKFAHQIIQVWPPDHRCGGTALEERADANYRFTHCRIDRICVAQLRFFGGSEGSCLI
jgi:hypothetical protein